MSTGEARGSQFRDYRKLFHESYLRTVVGGDEGFFGRFYEIFLAADPEVSRAFSRTDMHRQISMLQESLLYMIEFANSEIASDRMQGIAARHGSEGMNISPLRSVDGLSGRDGSRARTPVFPAHRNRVARAPRSGRRLF